MSVLLETSCGDIVIDLYTKKASKTCENFIKLCKSKYYNFCLFPHNLIKNYTLSTGDPTGTGKGGQSIYPTKYFTPEVHPKLKHNKKGLVAMTCSSHENSLVAGSQFYITLSEEPLDYLNGKHAIFGVVSEGMDVLDKINDVLIDEGGRPFRDIRIKHTIILDDPYPDPPYLRVPPRSPSPTPEMLASTRIGENEELFPDNISPEEAEKEQAKKDADAQALTLELVGDLPFAEVKPAENVLFVCKLHTVTTDEDLELIFSRFGPILSCEVIRDEKTGDSLCYAFIEFENKEDAEAAYFKMDNVLIDDRRIHVDFSQSVAKVHTGYIESKRRQQESAPGYGGSRGFEKRGRYRDTKEGGREDDYDLVFEHEGRVDDEKGDKGRSGDLGYKRDKSKEKRDGDRRREHSRADDRKRDLSRERRKDDRHSRGDGRRRHDDRKRTRHDDDERDERREKDKRR